MRDGDASIEEVVASYYGMTQEKKALDDRVSAAKRRFTEMMDIYFNSKPNRGRSSITFTVAYDDEDGTRATGGDYKVTRVQRKSINWDVSKLRKRISKNLVTDVIDVSMVCIDPAGLARYVRSLGADPEVFKSFFNFTYSVNADEIDRLSEIGKITADDIDGCYEVVESKPWYRVSFKAAEDDGD